MLGNKAMYRELNACNCKDGVRSVLSIHRHAEPQDVEGVLKNFDLTSKYGPCLGLTRLQRYACVALCKANSSTRGPNETHVPVDLAVALPVN